MIHKQSGTPVGAHTGDAWLDPKGSFKRVLSRGGAWENVNLGEKHRDEVDHEQEQRAEPEQREPGGTEVSSGAGESAPGDGDDGETVSESSGGRGTENAGVTAPAGHETNDDVSGDGEPLTSTGPIEGGAEGEGVDGNGSPVV